MSSENLSNYVIEPLVSKYEECFEGKDHSFIKREVFQRGATLGIGCVALPALAIETLIGVILGVGVILTGGKSLSLYEKHLSFIAGSKFIFKLPFECLLKTVNPNADFLKTTRNGIISSYTRDFFRELSTECRSSENILIKHVISRLTYAAMAISMTISRIVDGAIGLLTVPLSILTLGKIKSINHTALEALHFTGIIQDLLYCTMKFINPWTGTNPLPDNRLSPEEINRMMNQRIS